jgi:hypothetical protein
MFKVFRYVAAVVMIAALGPAIEAARSQEGADLFQSTVLCAFEERLAQYAALHRKLEAPLPLKPSVSAYALSVRRGYLASAIKNARPSARQGEFFTPDVAQVFRDIIDVALTGRDAEAMLNDLYDDHPAPLGFHPRVYDPYPEWATHEMPIVLVQSLPPLPEDLEYRLLDHDLVLWDIHADLMLDVLPDAIPLPSS